MSEAVLPREPAARLASGISSASGAGSERLPLSTFVAYGMPRLAMGFVGVVVALYFVKFGTDVLLIAPATMGLTVIFMRFRFNRSEHAEIRRALDARRLGRA